MSVACLKPFDVFSHTNTCTRERTFKNVSKALLVLLQTFVIKVLHFICLELKAAREYGWILRARQILESRGKQPTGSLKLLERGGVESPTRSHVTHLSASSEKSSPG